MGRSWWYRLLRVVATVLASLRCCHALPRECTPMGHTLLQNPHRSMSFNFQGRQPSSLRDFICDNSLTPGWYRFQIFDNPATMPTTCVEVNHCGTQAPVWLSLGEGQTLPRPMEVKQFSACAAWQSFHSATKDCCFFRIPVSVRNCGHFYVYMLQPTQGCMGYCAQAEPSSSPPRPTVTSELMGNSVYLKCSFKALSTRNSLGYIVVWSRMSTDDSKEELKQETTLQTFAIIEFDGINLRLGDMIFCSYSSFFLETPEIQELPVESDGFFAGIQLAIDADSIDEDSREHELSIESTVPIPCPSENSPVEECAITLQLSVSHQGEKHVTSNLVLSSCYVELHKMACEKRTCSKAVVHFMAANDFERHGDKTYEVSVKPIISQNFLWRGYTPKSVQIVVKDMSSAYCYIFTASHIMTFDGRQYDHYNTGASVLYKSTRRDSEVHVRQWECGTITPASCVCGFAAQEGGEIMAFDMCSTRQDGSGRPRISLRSRDQGSSRVHITESYGGRKVTVIFPSGTFIRADLADWGMSVTLRIPSSDFGATEGLCGTFDRNPKNDFHKTGAAAVLDLSVFLRLWRLPPGNSLFENVPSRESPSRPRNYCDCEKVSHTLATCSQPVSVTFPAVIPALEVMAERVNISALTDPDTFPHHVPHNHSVSRPTWPTASGLTRAGARQLCQRSVLDSSLGRGCGRFLATVMDMALEACVSDLQLGEERLWLSATLPLLENECERQLLLDGGWHENIRSLLRCPGLCSGSGRCSQRGCVCLPGFSSYDCSNTSDEIPEITMLDNSSLCDVQLDEFFSIQVLGQGFRDSSYLKCEIVKEEFLDGQWMLGNPALLPASYLNATAVLCQLPCEKALPSPGLDIEMLGDKGISRWQIKVSNDGYGFSNAKVLMLYNGTCQICRDQAEGHCKLKGKTCHIDGVCYAEGDMNPSSRCLLCQPHTSPFTWSVNDENRAPTLDPTQARLQTFQGENLEYQFLASDPDGSAVRFSLESGPERAKLSPAGLLRWSTGPPAHYILQLVLTDDCNAKTKTLIEVLVQPCGCENGGSCVTDMKYPAGRGEYLCVCPPGLQGGRCETRAGRCATCGEDVHECASVPCFPGVSCKKTLGSYVCGSCPEGFTGDGRICQQKQERGRSNAGHLPSRRTQGSLRPNTHFGLLPNPCLRRPCFTGVQCFQSIHLSAGFTCGPCPPGFHGDGSNCTKGSAAGDTSVMGRGSNAHPNRWRQDLLARVEQGRPSGSYLRTVGPRVSHNKHPPASKFPSSGKNRNASSSGTPGTLAESLPCAPCFPGVACAPAEGGAFKCGPCPNGYTGDGVSCRALCRYSCGRNMECSLPNTCKCKEGYTGFACHIALCRPDCKNQGKCVKPNLCNCTVGYSGPTCEEAHCEPPCQHGGTCQARNLCSCPYGYVGPRCQTVVCNRHCEHGGECVAPDVCKCKPGWHGPTCSSADCKPVCLNGGTCMKSNVCVCPSGFFGSQCQKAICSPPCKNGGQCMRNNVCSCPEGYIGMRCQTSVCDPTCMNKGKCVSPNMCSCTSGWRGKKCNIPICLQKCKSGGECVGPNTCHCPPGWEGLQCQAPVCHHKCLHGGRCVLPDFCLCLPGYSGATCATKT